MFICGASFDRMSFPEELATSPDQAASMTKNSSIGKPAPPSANRTLSWARCIQSPPVARSIRFVKIARASLPGLRPWPFYSSSRRPDRKARPNDWQNIRPGGRRRNLRGPAACPRRTDVLDGYCERHWKIEDR